MSRLTTSFACSWMYCRRGSTASPIRIEKRASAEDRKSTRLNSSHGYISYAGFCLQKKTPAFSTIFQTLSSRPWFDYGTGHGGSPLAVLAGLRNRSLLFAETEQARSRSADGPAHGGFSNCISRSRAGTGSSSRKCRASEARAQTFGGFVRKCASA